MSYRRTIEMFERWKADRADLVLATVIDTEGSTYSKTGYRMLLNAAGEYEGLVSGGCLEGDLADHARKVLSSGKARTVTYDMRDEATELWGLGAGCKGIIRILLQKLDAKNDYEPFTSIAAHILNGKPAACAIVVDSENPALPAGATLIHDDGHDEAWQVPQPYLDLLRGSCTKNGTRLQPYDTAEGAVTILASQVTPMPWLLVLGAGRDAEPVVSMGCQLGWQIVVADHREGLIEQGDFEGAQAICLIEPDQLSVVIDLSKFSAIIVMSHHLDTDRRYLEQLANANVRYLGLLGPMARRERLLADLGDSGTGLAKQLRGPVGLDIGANSPESIALSLLAEIHAVLEQRRGQSLTSPD